MAAVACGHAHLVDLLINADADVAAQISGG
jgi:hypothetical protein